MSAEMSQEVAIKALIQGIVLAQSRGAYSLDEAEILSQAIKKFVKTVPRVPSQQLPLPQKAQQPQQPQQTNDTVFI